MKQRKKKITKKVTPHVIEHSNAESLTHAMDKIHFDGLRLEERKSLLMEDLSVLKMSDAVLVHFSLDAKYKTTACENLYLISKDGPLSLVAGDVYEAFHKDESEKRTHYRPEPSKKPNKIAKHSSVNIITFHLLPAHALFIRTLPMERQREFILFLAAKLATLMEARTGWRVLGVAIHNDTNSVHFDLMTTRYSEPVRPLSGTRQRVHACELLGDRRGIRAVGPCVTGFFRLAAEKQLACIRPGLREDALYKYKAHLREYAGEKPTDMMLALAIDKVIREKFGQVAEFATIRADWYRCQAWVIRKRAFEAVVDLIKHDCLLEKKPNGMGSLGQLMDGYIAGGAAGLADAVNRMTADLTGPWRERTDALTRENHTITARLVTAQAEESKLKAFVEASQQRLLVAEEEKVALGHRVEHLSQEVAMFEEQSEIAESEKDQLVACLTHSNKRKSQLSNALEDRDAQINGLTERLAVFAAEKDKYSKELIDLRSRIDLEAALNARLAVRDDALNELKRQIEVLRSQNEDLSRQCSQLTAIKNDTASRSEREIARLTSDRTALETQLQQAQLKRVSDETRMKAPAGTPAVPVGSRLGLFNVREGKLVGFGSKEQMLELGSRVCPVRFYRILDVSMLSAADLAGIQTDPVSCHRFIDGVFSKGAPNKEFMDARFPTFEGTGRVEEALQNWGPRSYASFCEQDAAHRGIIYCSKAAEVRNNYNLSK